MKLTLSKPVQGQHELYVHFFPCQFDDVLEVVDDAWEDDWNEIHRVLWKRWGQMGETSSMMLQEHVDRTACVVCKIHASSCTRLDTTFCTTFPMSDGFSVCSPIELHYRKAKGRKAAFARAIADFTREERGALWGAYLSADPKVLKEAA